MKQADKRPVSLKETLSSTRRSLSLWHTMIPGLLACKLLQIALSALTPYVAAFFSARLLNELAGGRDPLLLRQWALLALGTALGMALLSALVKRWKGVLAGNGSVLEWFALERLYAEKKQSLDFCDADGSRVQDLLAQIQQTQNWASWGLLHTLFDVDFLARAFFRIAGAAALSVSLFSLPVPAGSPMAFLNHPLCLAGLLALLLLCALGGSLLDNRAGNRMAQTAASARMGNRMFGYYGCFGHDPKRAGDARLYSQEEICRHYFLNNTTFCSKGPLAKIAWREMGPLRAAGSALFQACTGLAYLFVCLKCLGGAFPVGSVTQYVAAVTGLAQGLGDLITGVGALRTNAFFLRDTFAFLDIPNAMYQGSLTLEKRSDRQYDIEFRDVSFRYPGSEQWALRHVSLKFRVGRRLAVVGKNGSGKTTFIKLLCRLYDPTEGEILLNGINIRKYSYAEYFSLFSVVFQDFKLLSLPLGQNVAASRDYARPRAEDCLAKAGFGARLAALPQGLDTPLGKDFEENGVELSGGEAQKTAIARALYKNAPFIILDEPTAALDPLAEAEIYSKFSELVDDRTAIYISHRLSSCRFCDEIAVFDGGHLAQMGSHEALLSQPRGLYAQLWNAQAQYYTEA